MFCDGCCSPCPYNCGPTCPLPIQSCFPSCAGNFNQGAFLPYALNQMPAMQAPAIPTQNTPTFTPPPPLPNTVYNQMPMGYPGAGMVPVQPASYYPPQYPTYPTNYYPMPSYPMQVPSYWYGQ